MPGVFCTTLDPPVDLSVGNESSAIALRSRTWNMPADGTAVKLNVAFFERNDTLISLVKKHVKTWQDIGNIKFNFVETHLTRDVLLNAHIRITFQGQRIFQSNVGQDSLGNGILALQPSMTLGFTNDILQDEKEVRRLILHEFGHALGLLHEHTNPGRKFQFFDPDTYDYFFLTQQWDRKKVDDNIINVANRELITNSGEFDENSIMLYKFPNFVTLGGRTLHVAEPATHENFEPSQQDIALIKSLYPKKNGPTITNPSSVRLGFPLEIDKLTAGMIPILGKEIWYNFEITNPGVYSILTKTPPGKAEEAWKLTLFNEDRSPPSRAIADMNSPDEGFNALMEIDLPKGVYFLSVENHFAKRLGEYNLLLRKKS